MPSSKEFSMNEQRHLEKAQGLTEYAMILVLVAVVVIVTLQLVGPTIGNVFSTIVEWLQFD
jgi:pilus assembly protein Flp/PilA